MTQCSQHDAAVKVRGRSLPAGWPVRTEFSYGMGPAPTLVFDAQSVTSDAGLSVVREIDERMGLTEIAARFVDDHRHPDLVVHPIVRLIREAAYAYAAGYEDANDHPVLAGDAYFVSLVGPTNQNSMNPKRHDGLASEASLSRLLNGRALGFDRLGLAHVEWFARLVERHPPKTITLDIDGYDAETYGMQQLALFNGCYEETMYYPVVVTVAEYGFVVGGQIRPGNAGANVGAVELMRPILEALRRLLPNTRIRLRADSGEKSRSATEFDEEDWFVLLKKALRMDELLQRHSTIMDRYDPARRVALVVDEWGSWHAVEPGTNPGFLFQQNTIRDALVAGVTLNILNDHAERVRMANIAQTVNVLQAMVLTDGPRMLRTTTYHVYEMYAVHHDASLLDAHVICEDYTLGKDSIPSVSASASLDSAGKAHVTLCNLDHANARELSCILHGMSATALAARVLSADAMGAHNSFDAPDRVVPAPFEDVRLVDGGLALRLPPRSVVAIEVC